MAVHAHGRPGTRGTAVVGHRHRHLVAVIGGGRSRSYRARCHVATCVRRRPPTGPSLAVGRYLSSGLEPYHGRVVEPSTPAVGSRLSRTLARTTPVGKLMT